MSQTLCADALFRGVGKPAYGCSDAMGAGVAFLFERSAGIGSKLFGKRFANALRAVRGEGHRRKKRAANSARRVAARLVFHKLYEILAPHGSADGLSAVQAAGRLAEKGKG